MTVSVEVVAGHVAEVEARLPAGTAEIEAQVGPSTTVELVGGTPGPAGPPGPPGPPGPGGASSYTHVQGIAAAVWTITHDLGYMPSVTVVDSAHEVVEGDVIYGPVGTVSIIFSAAFAGTAYLS